MEQYHEELTLLTRLRRSAEQLQKSRAWIRPLLFYGLGFAFLFLLIVSSFGHESAWLFWLLVNGFIYFWLRFNRLVLKAIDPPEEIYLLLFMVGGVFEICLLNSVAAKSGSFWPLSGTEAFFSAFNLFLMVAAAGLLLTKENKGNFLAVLAYWLLLLFSHYTIFFNHSFSKIVLMTILFFGLLKRTNWLDKLTRIELALYLIFFFILFLNFKYPVYFDLAKSVARHSDQAFYQYSLPQYLYYFGKIYLLVLMIRIPLVLIYNYAPISRKLWMATLFQATIPQFIQLFLLLYIFYLFIAGWQAHNLRQALNALTMAPRNLSSKSIHVKPISKHDLSPGISSGRIFAQNSDAFYFYEDSLANPPAYYLVFSPQSSSPQTSDSLYAIKVDRALLHYLFVKTDFIVSSGLAVYRYHPNRLMAYLYRIKFWQAQPVRINPIGILNPFVSPPASNVVLWSYDQKDIDPREFYSYRDLNWIPLIVGRLFLPTGKKDEYFTVDLFYNVSELLQWNFLTQTLLVLIGVFFFLNTLIVRRMARFGKQINRTIVEKFKIMRKGLHAIAAGDLNYRVRIQGADEFSEFADHFNQMTRALQRFMKEAAEKERMDQELKMAHQVQLKMLPNTLPSIPGYKIAADLSTANEVGGDFYDVFALDAQRFFIAIGDVSGKGMSAAFYMAQLISLLRYSTTFTTDLVDLTLRLNAYMVRHVLDANIFVTAILGILDIQTHCFEFIRAGHNFPLLLNIDRDGIKLKEIPSNGMALGMTSDQALFKRNLSVSKVSLSPNASLILYTDGFTEAAKKANGQEILYGEERFFDRLKQYGRLNPETLVLNIKKDVENFYAGAAHTDDQTIVILRRLK